MIPKTPREHEFQAEIEYWRERALSAEKEYVATKALFEKTVNNFAEFRKVAEGWYDELEELGVIPK